MIDPLGHLVGLPWKEILHCPHFASQMLQTIEQAISPEETKLPEGDGEHPTRVGHTNAILHAVDC